MHVYVSLYKDTHLRTFVRMWQEKEGEERHTNINRVRQKGKMDEEKERKRERDVRDDDEGKRNRGTREEVEI